MLGQFVKARRLALGLTVAEAAKEWGMSESALYKIERGSRSHLYPDAWLNLARGLGVSVGELMAQGNGENSASRVAGNGGSTTSSV